MADSIAEQPQFKTCSNPDCPCDNPQPINQFIPDNRYQNRTRARCKTCCSTAGKIRRANNPDYMREYNKRYYEENADRERERSRGRYASNPEHQREAVRRSRFKHVETVRIRHRKESRLYRLRNPNKVREGKKRWQTNNPDKTKASAQRRQARKRSFPVNFTASDWHRCVNYWNNHCCYCGNGAGLFFNMKIVAEHFVPLSNPNCPGTIPKNILPACRACNNSKRDKDAEQWLIAKFGEKQAKKILKCIQDYFDSLKNINSMSR